MSKKLTCLFLFFFLNSSFCDVVFSVEEKTQVGQAKHLGIKSDNKISDNNIINKHNNEKNNKGDKNIVNSKTEQKFHIVAPNENVYRICLKYQISQNDLLSINNLSNTNVFVGQKLLLPKNAIIDNANNNSLKGVENNKANTEGKNVNNGFVNTSNIKSEVNDNMITKIDYSTFIWPTRGKILTHFGYLTSGGKLEGVNIGTEANAQVRASSSGEIVYNDKVDGYDNVIIIKHYNGFYTAYGHTDPLITKGDKVKKGQIIAHITKDRNSKRSVLYFSIRKNQKSYDPENIIQDKIDN